MSAIDLEGVINFRDFGGAPAGVGRRVRTGRLYRSGHHATATEADLGRLAELDFALIVDLRRPPERARDPARRPASSRAQVLEHKGPEAQATPPHLAFLAQPDASPDLVTRQMIVGYRGYPFDPHYIAVYREYFGLLGEIDGPVMINCHAGKDRTGFLCALTLYTLGVHRDDILADYLETNRHNRADERMAEMMEQFARNNGHPASEALLRRMMAADAAYLEAAFAEIEAQHGSVDAYLSEVVGMSTARRDALRERLVA
ncbi:MAG TPA: tyrosine-protein phosphatase [Caulobacteraceae bacterium]|nr:tyrosine-protein phosphatase [Caulobacteraceae bacterium]